MCLASLAVTGCNLKYIDYSSSKNDISSSLSVDESHQSSAETSSSLESSSSISSKENSSSSSAVSSSSKVSSSSEKSSSVSSSSVVSSSSEKSSSVISSSSQASSSTAISSSSSSSSSSSASSSSSSSSSIADRHATINVFGFNDTHGNVTDTYGKGLGITKSTTALKELSAGKNSIFISQGDMWQGSAESNLTRGNLVTEWMNSLNFVSMTVGNHEYDWKDGAIKDNIALANFPFLGINVLNRSDNQRVDYLQPSTVVERGGAKIGIIGAIGNCYSSITSSNVRDIYFAVNDQLTNLVKAESTRLRTQENCDFVIYSIHGDSRDDYYDESLSTDGYVNLVLEGHSHQEYDFLDGGNVLHIQNKASNMEVYEIEIDLNLTNKTYELKAPVFHDFTYSSSPYKNYAQDSAAKAIMDKYYSTYSVAYEELGMNDTYRNSYELRSKVADLYYEKGLEKWGANYDLTLGGGYISCRGNGISAGMVKYADIYECFPFDNEIALCSIRGSAFVNTQFITGNSNYYITWKDNIALSQYDIDTSKTYYLVTDTYTVDYYSSLNVIEYYKPNTYARDLLADYVRAGNWTTIVVPPDGHDGTITDPKTIAEALELATLYTSAGASTAYYFKGVVCRLGTRVNPDSGDMNGVYVEDEGQNNGMMIYWLKRFDGATASNGWSSVDDLHLGDELIFCGKPFTYNGTTPEFGSGAYVYSINGVVTDPYC